MQSVGNISTLRRREPRRGLPRADISTHTQTPPRRADATAASMGLIGGSAMFLVNLSEGYLRAGRPEDALAAGRRALTPARDHNERGHEAWTLRMLGEIAIRRDPPDVDAAEEHGRHEA